MARDAIVVRIERRWIRFVVVVAVTAAAVFPVGVWAGDRFSDVPESNAFHDDIAWLANAGVTKGCNPPANTEFCPGAPVTRQQMAAFLKRLAESGTVDAGTIGGLFSTDLVTVAEFDKDAGAVIPGGAGMTDVATYTYDSGSFLFGGGVLVQVRADVFNVASTATTVTCELEPDQVGSGSTTRFDAAGATDGDDVSLTLFAVAFDDNAQDQFPPTATLRCMADQQISVSNVAFVGIRSDFLFDKSLSASPTANASEGETRVKQP